MDIETELANFLGEKRALVDAITRELRAGTSANAVAREVARAFGRDQVKEFAAALRMHDTAQAALAEAGIDGADIRPPGIDPPRETRLNLVADPSEDGYETLPARIRAALREYHITLGLTRDDENEHGDSSQETVDEILLEGERVRLVPLKPRTPTRKEQAAR